MAINRYAVFKLSVATNNPEYAVAYVSDDWDGLKKLLNNPMKELLALAPAGSMPEINLVQPTVIVLEGVDARCGIGKTFESIFDLQVPKNTPTMAVGQKYAEKIQEAVALREPKKNGIFMAEFAINTRTLYIRYVPPKPEDTTIAFDPAGKVTDQTLMMWSTFKGNLHFDIGNDANSIGTFVTDYITDRATLVQTCLKKSNKKLFAQFGGVPMSDKGNAFAIQMGTEFGDDVRLQDNCSFFPMVIIEQVGKVTESELREDDPEEGDDPVPVDGCVCVDIDVATNDGEPGGVFELGTAMIKIYAEPCPTDEGG